MPLEIKILDYGDIELESSFLVLGRGCGRTRRVPTLGFLILGGPWPIVVDTGYRSNQIMETLGMRGLQFHENMIENQLKRHGVRMGDVRYVMHTHLHIDHTGWNTTLRDGRWVPTFPNAKYVFHKGEYAAWEVENAKGSNPPGTVFRDNCLPIVDAGQALLIDDDYALDDTVTLTPTPGPSPCHCCVNIFSKGQHAIVTGDLMHHQIQCREPDWSAKPDWDPRQSAVSRRKFFASVADTDTLILPIHFPAPTAGLIKPLDGAFDYQFRRS